MYQLFKEGRKIVQYVLFWAITFEISFHTKFRDKPEQLVVEYYLH